MRLAQVAPAPQAIVRDGVEGSAAAAEPSKKLPPVGGPQSKCQTKEEAEEWATQWWKGYTPHAHAPDLYFAPARLYDLLEPLPDGTPAPVKLLKSSWVLNRAEQLRRCATDVERSTLRMPRRQELPPEAFLSSAEVRSLPRGQVGKAYETCCLDGDDCNAQCYRDDNDGCSCFGGDCWCCKPWRLPMALTRCQCFRDRADRPLKLASISHGWLSPEHPDPYGQQLVRFADQVKSEREWSNEEACCFKWCCGCPGSLCFVPCYGQPCCASPTAFPSSEFAVFYDWGSLVQKDPRGERTPQEVQSFKQAINTMGVWYAHRLTTTFIMSELPEGWPKTEDARPFFPDGWLRGKGWPTFERAVSGLVKRASTNTTWRRIVDPAVGRTEAIHASGHRDAPLPPREFAAELAQKVFTNGADCEVVARLYADTLAGALGAARVLEFCACQWGDDDAELLAGVLPMAARVETIDVSGNSIGKRGFDALAAAISGGAAPALKTFVYDGHSDDSAALREACKSRGVK